MNIRKLLDLDQPQKQTCVVIDRKLPGRYRLRDQLNRIIEADSSAVWRPGTSVTVQNGRIVGVAEASSTVIIEV